jgi:hypothetical protein
LSSPDNPLPQDSLVAEPTVPAAAPQVPINPNDENPVWSGLDVFLIALVLITAVFFFSVLIFGIAAVGRVSQGGSAADIARNPSGLVLVPVMVLSYLVTMTFMYLLIRYIRNYPFWQAVRWKWPSGGVWFLYLCGGVVLAFVVGVISKFLPIPKKLPIDLMFRDRASAFLLAGFGIAIAPLVEELCFRGFLYPVLARWLPAVLAEPKRSRQGRNLLLLMAVWGYVAHSTPRPWHILVLALPFIGTLIVFLVRAVRATPRPEAVILPGAALFVWGFVGRAQETPFLIASLLLLVLAFALNVAGISRPLASSPARSLGIVLAVVLTSTAFAFVHASQLGGSWSPLLLLFTVGAVLTVTRAVTRSVTPGVLLHMGYNFTLFGLMYLATDHFRHLEKLGQ